ncbi:MAG TPA: hypothetical protein VLA89_02890 [Gemmatimonadales bacterium]|nr:hypothetical protein [Gemmatimonadales bacterium]
MARRQWSDIGGLPYAIIQGEHDDDLSYIQMACKQRLKRLYRKGARVRLVGLDNPTVDGCEGRIEKTNQKSVTVILDDGRGYNVVPEFLELVPGTLTQVPVPHA